MIPLKGQVSRSLLSVLLPAILLLAVLLAGCVSQLYPALSEPARVLDGELPVEMIPLKHAAAPQSKEQSRASASNAGEFPLEITATVTHPATILGKSGFSPAELALEVGDSVTWTNADPQRKTVVLTFQKVNTRTFITSPSLHPGTAWENTFTEPGEYVYWSVGHGVKGKLMVEEDNP